MTIKMMFPVALLAAGLSMFAGDASAANGKKKSLLTGAAAGVAVGAVGTYLLTRNSGASAQQPQQDAEPRYTNSVRPARYQSNDDEDTCAVKKIDLFDRKGNFVKSEKMRVCN